MDQTFNQGQQFQTGCDKLIGLVDDRTDYLVEQLTVRLAAVQAAEASLVAAAQRIPREVKVNWLGQWQLTAGFILGPLLLVWVMLWFTGMFSRVPKEQLAAVQEQVELFRQGRAALAKELPDVAHRYFPYGSDTKSAPAALPAKKKGRR